MNRALFLLRTKQKIIIIIIKHHQVQENMEYGASTNHTIYELA